MKKMLYELFRLAAHFFSFCCLPLVLLITFNYTKGIANNEDGILFIPFGIHLLISLIALNVVLLRKRRAGQNRLFWLILGVTAALALCLTFPMWEDFFRCLAFFKGFNLGRQV